MKKRIISIFGIIILMVLVYYFTHNSILEKRIIELSGLKGVKIYDIEVDRLEEGVNSLNFFKAKFKSSSSKPIGIVGFKKLPISVNDGVFYFKDSDMNSHYRSGWYKVVRNDNPNSFALIIITPQNQIVIYQSI